MKLFVCGWRPWSVAGRYKSLMLNAKRLGHEVLGIASRQNDRQDLTMDVFEQLGIDAVVGPPGVEFTKDVLDRFQPDVIFGEQYWNCPEELAARNWAREHGKKHLVLDHNKNYGSTTGPILDRQYRAQSTTTIMAATEDAAEILTRGTRAKVVVTGQPQYDLAFGDFDVPAIRERLGVAEGQKLIALTQGAYYLSTGEPLVGDTEWLGLFLSHAAREGWRVVCHPHPEERLRKDQLTCDAVPRLAESGRAAYLRAMQDWGVLFVSDFPAGVANGVRFEQCPVFDLLAAADGVTGCSDTFMFPCYAMGKMYFPFGGMVTTKMPNVGRLEKNFGEFTDAVNLGSHCKQDEETTRRFFYKLDGLCWERMLKEAGDGRG